jgi:hypothetical protein
MMLAVSVNGEQSMPENIHAPQARHAKHEN